MTAHAVKVTPVTRRTHDLERVTYIIRCNTCTFRAEHRDDERAVREARRHEAERHPVGGGEG